MTCSQIRSANQSLGPRTQPAAKLVIKERSPCNVPGVGRIHSPRDETPGESGRWRTPSRIVAIGSQLAEELRLAAVLTLGKDIGRSEQVTKPPGRPFEAIVYRAGHGNKRFGAELVAYLGKLRSNLIKRLAPGYPLPFSISPLPGPLQGIIQSVSMAMEIDQSGSLDAKMTFSERARAIADNPGDFTLLNLDFNAAVAGAQAAKGPFRHDLIPP